MNQPLDTLAVSFAVRSAPAIPAARPASLPITPDGEDRAARRAATLLAAAGRRLALVVRRFGRPTEVYSGPDPVTPEDIRARFVLGLYGSVEAPRSLRDPSRRW